MCLAKTFFFLSFLLTSYYQSESFNVQEKYECVEYFGGNRKHASRYNNEADCTENGGEWLAFTNYLEKALRK